MNLPRTDKKTAILRTLRAELNAKKYPLNSRFPSEYLLAERFGVNKTTANKAVAVLTSEGYLKRGRGGQGTIVVRHTVFPRKHVAFIGKIQHPFIAMEAHGVQAAALEDNSLVSLISPSPNDLNRILNQLSGTKIDGIVSTCYGLLPEIGLPVVYLEDRVGETIFPDFAACDSYHAAYQMMQELLKRGHREIVLLCQTSSNPDRLRGYYDAMREVGIMDYEKRTFQEVEATIGESKLLLKRILRRYPDFTAMAACSDNDLHRMIISMRQEGVEWEYRKAMIGFGNVPGISDVYPIATVDQHPMRIGAEAYRLLLEKIDHPEKTMQEFLDTELVNLQNIPVIQRGKMKDESPARIPARLRKHP